MSIWGNGICLSENILLLVTVAAVTMEVRRDLRTGEKQATKTLAPFFLNKCNNSLKASIADAVHARFKQNSALSKGLECNAVLCMYIIVDC